VAAAGDGQHGRVDRQGTAEGGEEGLLGADSVRHKFLDTGQHLPGGGAVVQAGGGENVGVERAVTEPRPGLWISAGSLAWAGGVNPYRSRR
jgi:hypothetical protein